MKKEVNCKPLTGSMFNTKVFPFGLLQCMVDIGQYLGEMIYI